MPLVSMVSELRKAQEGHYAVPLFDAFEMNGLEGTIAALEEMQSPGIIGVVPSTLELPEARAFIAYIRIRAEDSSVPISIILDHGTTFEQCVKILNYGATDVMYDGGHQLPYKENVEVTRMVVSVAHTLGAGVEAELGWVGVGSDYTDPEKVRNGFTKPEEAERFVEETGVDSLAIAFGSAHGIYEGEPQLDLERVADIRQRVETPLVLHGGSGLEDEQYRGAIKSGIAKINIFTNLAVTAGEQIAAVAKTEYSSYWAFNGSAKTAFQERCKHYIEVFGSAGKA